MLTHIKGTITNIDGKEITVRFDDGHEETLVPFWETPFGKAWLEGRLAMKVTQDGAMIYETRPSN